MAAVSLANGIEELELGLGTVLLVHDSPVYTEFFCKTIKAAGFAVRATTNGRAALKIIRLHKTDLIVSDVVMPEMDGIQLCRALKDDQSTCDIPVLLVTALRYDDEGVIDGLKAGAVDYLPSGAPAELLRRKCERLISERREKQARMQAEAALKTAYAELESRVEERTAELEQANTLLKQRVAERDRAEIALRESEERFRRTFEEAPIGMALMRPDFKFIKVNKRLCQMLGYTEAEFATLTLSKITDPDDLGNHLELARQVFDGERASYEIEKRYIRKDGEHLWANLTATVIRGQDGHVLYKLGMMEDISESKKMQEQLIQSEKLSALGQLVAGVAHELNNPLTSVIGYSQLTLVNPGVNDALRMQLETIRKEGERARRIIQNLLSFARQHKPGRTQTDINELLRSCLDLRLYSHTSNNIAVQRKLTKLPPVLADPHQLQQVFLNIIINAEQAMLAASNEGNLAVSTKLKELDGGQWVEIQISDDGPGIRSDVIGKVFDPFFTTKEVGQGTGLGLSISYGIIKEHAGKIHVESEPGRGATFFIDLPVH